MNQAGVLWIRPTDNIIGICNSGFSPSRALPYLTGKRKQKQIPGIAVHKYGRITFVHFLDM